MTKILDQTFYSVQETAEKLGVTPQTIRAYIKSGKIAGQKVGRGFYVAEKSLEDFLKLERAIDPDPAFTAKAGIFLYKYRGLDPDGLVNYLEAALLRWQKKPTIEGKVSILELMVEILEEKLETVK